jgi:hypothetical protein
VRRAGEVVFAMSGGGLLQPGVPEGALARPQTHVRARQHHHNMKPVWSPFWCGIWRVVLHEWDKTFLSFAL